MKYIIILLFLSINLQAQTYEQLIENFHQPEYNNLRDQLEKTPQDQEDLELRKCYPFHKSELALTEEEQRLNVAYYERLDILKDRLKNVGNVSERDDIQKSINQLEAERLNELRAFFAPYSNSIYGKYRMEFYPNNTGRANIHIIKEDNIESNLLELSQEPFLQKIKEFQLDFASLKKRYNSYLLWSGVEQYTVSFAMHWEQFQQLEALFLSGDGGNQRMHLNPYRKKITLDALPKLPNLKRLSLASLNIEDVSSVRLNREHLLVTMAMRF